MPLWTEYIPERLPIWVQNGWKLVREWVGGPQTAVIVTVITSPTETFGRLVSSYIQLKHMLLTCLLGRWSKDEEEILKQIVPELCGNFGNTLWTEVSKRMGGTRTRQQCSEKWYVGPLCC